MGLVFAPAEGCGQKYHGTPQDAEVIFCQGDQECPVGMLCIGNVCQLPVDAGIDASEGLQPNITVDPTELDFGFAPLRVDTSLPVTITNTGEADLEITALLIEEVDQLHEFFSSPGGVQDPAIVLEPGDSIVVDVTLRPEDGELDEGRLLVNSNDPDQATAAVALTSGYKGTPDLEACSLDFSETDPEPFVDCTVAEITTDPIIDYGVVYFQEDASRLVVVRNIADGNAPLTIDDVYLTNFTGLGSHYSLEIFTHEVDPITQDSTEVPVELPVYLRSFDPVNLIEEDHLYVRVWFDAELAGNLPAENLVYQSNDDENELVIPIFGVVSGCPEGTWDVNQDPDDGCEYVCNYTGPETCDASDNDCDGEMNEEDALGCTVYYLDMDGDTFGVTTDSRCLCAPDFLTHHTATAGGDCDDTSVLVNPGMIEQCFTTFDDNCDGVTNELDGAGCSTFYLDQDSDGYGETGNTACYCAATGQYTATVGDDCDDGNPNANPGAVEDCTTAFDDNCDGSTNEPGGLGCVEYYIDLDQDSHGQPTLSLCLCQPEGDYTALVGDDCNDTDAAVNPDMQEDCSTGYDDNCNVNTNELGALNCTDYYLDQDNDGAGVTGNIECRCAPAGDFRALTDGDCDDADGAVHPLALENCVTPYDDNCDGDANDLNAAGCATYYLDADQDNYGVLGSTECRCQGAGDYTAVAPGDCDDTNTLVHPAAQETCDTAYDDNCDSNPNNLNAINCVNYFWDGDNDGYGLAAGVECRCAPTGLHTALQPGDCNEGDPTINPGAAEICDYVDNNCQNGTDEGFDTLTDPSNCGTCGTVCVNDNGTTSCANGVCDPVCDPAFGDCDGDPTNGCETDLATVTTCGVCVVDTDCPNGFFCDAGLCTEKLGDGELCNRAEACESGFCVDGVCCENACDSLCEACDIVGSEGACTPHPGGLDPDGDCDGTAQTTCGLNGNCDGMGACARWDAGTVCVQQSCSGYTRYPADTCDGSGTCTDGGSQDCTPYICAGTDCRTDCTDNSHCTAGYYCNGGACVPKIVSGPCTIGSECASGYCVDAYCCDTPCNGTCRACDLTGQQSTCSFRPANTDPEGECPLCRVCNGIGACATAANGTDPKNDCAPAAQSSCDDDGECDGSGACRNWASGTECVPQSCTGNTKWLADSCDGGGICTDGGSVDCSPYLCLGSDCRTDCTLDGHCIPGSWCNGLNQCEGAKGLGQSCSNDSECQSGNCADGVCCNGPCTGMCQSCNLPGTVGMCTNVPANQDPDGECAGTCASCNGGGACGATAAGSDPENDCAQQAPDTCGSDGECDGSGGCRQWAAGTECLAQSCTGSTRYLADTCDGSGTCVDIGSVSCVPYICDITGTNCRVDCSLDTHCTTGNYCNAGLCAAKKPIGETCTASNECSNGFCIDGYCCNSACSGACVACNIAGSEGTCANHTAGSDPEASCGICRVCNGLGSCTNAAAGSDPKTECDQDSQSSCGQDGDCDGSGACGRWSTGTECQAAYCFDISTQMVADTCDGAGVCLDNGNLDCTPYICQGSFCRTDCSLDSHCTTGNYCNAGSCAAKRVNGQTCTGSGECSSGFCVDGYCCNGACSGACRACDIVGSEGACTNHPSQADPEAECGACQVCNGGGVCAPATDGTDPKTDCATSTPDTCGFDGECNGTGGCRYWAVGTECVAPSCSGFTRYPADNCNGAGACLDSGSVSCDPYVCNGDICRTDCTLQTHCTGGNYCSASSTCVAQKSNSQSCAAAVECTSGNCVDGFCCNTACGGICEACNVVGWMGTCTQHTANTDPESECPICQACDGASACVNAPAGSDPKFECVQSAESTCGFDGQCSGIGACRYWPGTTVCNAQSCTNNVRSNTDLCDGTGTCVDSGTMDCSPYECNGDDCYTSCSSDAHCVSGYYCAGVVCLARKPNGQACAAANECTSGNCVDGFCCNNSCAGVCRACNVAASEGTCTFHTGNTDPEGDCLVCQACNGLGACISATDSTDPKNQCDQDAQTSCGQDGDCDGAGACGRWPAGTECLAAYCVDGNTRAVADTCDGAGLCVDNSTVDCSPYICQGTACRTDCTLDSHCTAGNYCNLGSCTAKKANGQVCAGSTECSSDNCVDGYCCDDACGGACRACNVAAFEGTCTFHTNQTDPEAECGTCQACNGGGLCAPATDGSDPKAECAASTQDTCGFDGECNGNSGCRYWAVGTECVPQSCTGFTRSPADTCSGAGVCLDSGSVSCDPYVCTGDVCRTDCTLQTHCAPGNYCTGSNICVVQKANGLSCASADECSSGNCVDGYCCNTACAFTCEGCAVAGAVGTCTQHAANTDPDADCPLCRACNSVGACVNATVGTDPKAECAQVAESTCGFDGDCSGIGACRYWPGTTVCNAQSCTNNVRSNTDLCDGTGTCIDSGTLDCSPYECNGDDCHASCSSDTQCIAGYYCGGVACVATKANGQTCTAANECSSGNCVDGYCCNSTCAGSCRACNVAASEGTCTFHTGNTDPEGDCLVCQACNGLGACINATDGTDPRTQCDQDAQTSCGQDGDCDGAGTCGRWPAGTECQAAYCVDGNTGATVDTCDGAGLCVDSGTTACAPYVCEGTACRTDCTLDTHCQTGSYCNAGVCVAKKANGQVCAGSTECTSGNCVDGYCCNSACSTTCRACNVAGFLGTCTLHANQADPEAECGTCQACNGGGACAPTTAGTDPKAECAAAASTTCGFDGECNGNSGCRYWPIGTECAAQTCVGATRYPADTCNGAGACLDSGSASCNGYTCLGNACRTTCTLLSHCDTGYYCTAANTCAPKQASGFSCSAAEECLSNFCADGVCCNSDCVGICRACNIAGALGTCTNHAADTDPESECGLCLVCTGAGGCAAVVDGADPKNDCTADTQASCGLDGDCNGLGVCGLWPSSTSCAAQTCANNIRYAARTCDGAGTCDPAAQTNCTPYECSGNDCGTGCGSDAECVTGYYCSGGACVAKQANGAACGAGNECQTGFCVDGYCCNTGCSGDCRACNIAGSLGTCTNHVVNTDPDGDCGLCQACSGTGLCSNVAIGSDPLGHCAQDSQSSCGQDGECDGFGACDLWSAGTVCTDPICLGSTLQVTDQCNGTGTCNDGGTQDCLPYVCAGSGTACRTDCALNAHCVSGYYCDGGVCVPESVIGDSCTSDAQCSSGFCRDGYCCDSDCSSFCRACNVAGLEGTCTFHAINTDPENDCGICRVCNGSGVCLEAADGTDPGNDCIPDTQASCDYDGECNGAGSCRYWAAGTVCLAGTCVGSTLYPNDTCSGGGVCVDNGSANCAPYMCNGNICGTSCSSDLDCTAGNYCSASNSCEPLKANGALCSTGTECTSTICADGRCCNNDCIGSCRACNVSGNEGTCTNYAGNTDPEWECGLCQVCNGAGACGAATAGTDPKNQCTWSDPSTCGFDGACNGAGACGYWPGGTICAAENCSGANVMENADTCNGSGACMDNGLTVCSPYICAGTACLTSCNVNADCMAGYECKANECRDHQILIDEDVEACDVPGWTVWTDGGSISWTCDDGVPPNHNNDTGGSGWMFLADVDAGGGACANTRMVSPTLNLTNYVEVWVRFENYLVLDGVWGYIPAEGRLQYTLNGGASWNTIEIYNIATSIRSNVDVSALVAGQPNVQFGWLYDDSCNWSYWWMIDDIMVDAY